MAVRPSTLDEILSLPPAWRLSSPATACRAKKGIYRIAIVGKIRSELHDLSANPGRLYVRLG
jgi:hypothetical protein